MEGVMNNRLYVLGAMLCVVLGGSARADENRQGEPFEVYAFECESNPGEIHQKGAILKIRNLYNTGLAYSTDPRLAGPANVVVNIRSNTQSNRAVVWGSLELIPDLYNGDSKWVGLFRLEPPGTPIRINGVKTRYTGIIVAHGTGDFEGLKLRFKHFFDPEAFSPPVPPPPGCSWLGEYWRGDILPVS
jgi:hypothetical protein